jgi:hypothetical protein
LGVLKVFISAGCRGCRRALELVELVRRQRPSLSIQVIDLSKVPEAGLGLVFAVPTYVYENRPIFLGNPSRQELEAWLNTLGAEV